MNRKTYSDDTTSGRWSTRLRGLRKVTIVARTVDDRSYDWLAAFKRDFLPPGVEAKSSNVLPILDAQPMARQYVLDKLGGSSIFIIDLHELHHRILGGIVERLRPVIPPSLDPYDFVLNLPYPKSDAHQFLRQIAIQGSVLGRLERLLTWCTNPFGKEMQLGCDEPFAPSQNFELANRTQLSDLDDRQLASFLARFGAAVGDALSRERQTEAFLRYAEGHRFFVGGLFACQLLRINVETDKIFDVGPKPVLKQLELADDQIWRFVENQVVLGLQDRVRRGIIDERASHIELGLQAADIAAALACYEYESVLDDNDGSRALAVKRLFDKVLLNDRWI